MIVVYITDFYPTMSGLICIGKLVAVGLVAWLRIHMEV